MENLLSAHEMMNGNFIQLQLIQPAPGSLLLLLSPTIRKSKLVLLECKIVKDTIFKYFLLHQYLSSLCLQTSSVWPPCASLQRLWFHRDPLRCDCDQRSRGDHGCRSDREASAACSAPRRRRVRGRGQRRRQEGRHRHHQGQSSGKNTHALHTGSFTTASQDHNNFLCSSLFPL